MVDGVPSVFSHFAMMIPSITHIVGSHLVAAKLINDHLAAISLTNLPLVLTAITAPKARATTNYEKLEFLGDSSAQVLHHCALPCSS